MTSLHCLRLAIVVINSQALKTGEVSTPSIVLIQQLGNSLTKNFNHLSSNTTNVCYWSATGLLHFMYFQQQSAIDNLKFLQHLNVI